MDFNIVKDFAETDLLADEWDALVEKSVTNVPFLRHAYLKLWWETLGGGEWKNAQLAIVVARRDGKLTGIAPLFIAPNREGKPALLFIGSIEITDYLDVIVRQEDLPEFLDGLLAYLERADLPKWEVLDWWNILHESPTLPALAQTAHQRGWDFVQEQVYRCPHIPLAGDWETYLAGLDKKERHEIRRKLRRVTQGGDSVHWYFIDDGADLEKATRTYLGLMSQDPDKARFLTSLMRLHMEKTIQWSFKAGFLRLAFLEIDGEVCATYMSLDYRNRLWVYNSGIDRRFMELSPGWVLVSYLLQWANTNQRSEVDFMRGDEDYKYRFGGIDRYALRAVVQKP